MPLKMEVGAKRNASLKQGMQVYTLQPTEQQPPPGTVILRNSLKILANLYNHQGRPRGREGGGANCHTNARFGVQNRTS